MPQRGDKADLYNRCILLPPDKDTFSHRNWYNFRRESTAASVCLAGTNLAKQGLLFLACNETKEVNGGVSLTMVAISFCTSKHLRIPSTCYIDALCKRFDANNTSILYGCGAVVRLFLWRVLTWKQSISTPITSFNE